MGAAPRVAVVGAGGWGRNHVRTFQDQDALALVCDPDPARRAEVEQTYPGLETCADAGEVFRREDIDGVVLATPAPTHVDLGLAALAAGKDVLVEKPLALDVAGGDRLVAAAEAGGRVLMVGHVLEYHPGVETLRNLVVGGELGRLRWASSNRLSLGKVRAVENVLWSFAVHDIALLIGLAGAEPELVAARGGAWITPGVEDVSFLGLSFPGGFEAQVSVSWLHPFKEHRLVVVGERAMAILDDTAPAGRKLTVVPYELDPPTAARPGSGSSEPIPVPVADELPLTRECRHFLERITDRHPALTDGVSGVRVLRVLEAADRSLAGRGRPVELTAPALSNVFVHPTATVDDGALIGAGTKVWHYAHVMPGARIGERCSLGQNVFVAGTVRIGAGVKIQNNVSVYDGVILDDGVFCGPSMVFTNVMNPRAEVERKDEYRSTRVGRGATLGANCTIVCGVTIGEYAFVAAGAVVTRDVAPYALVGGVPARLMGWMCACGQRLDEAPDPACARCGRRYRLDGGALVRA